MLKTIYIKENINYFSVRYLLSNIISMKFINDINDFRENNIIQKSNKI